MLSLHTSLLGGLQPLPLSHVGFNKEQMAGTIFGSNMDSDHYT